jgi:hypothetical protein
MIASGRPRGKLQPILSVLIDDCEERAIMSRTRHQVRTRGTARPPFDSKPMHSDVRIVFLEEQATQNIRPRSQKT